MLVNRRVASSERRDNRAGSASGVIANDGEDPSGSALDEGDEASKWFIDYLGKPSRLVRFNEESETRPVDPNYAPGFRVMFSDGYPFLLASRGSLDSLNERLEDPVPINRFRPKYVSVFTTLVHSSILVDGCEPFSEDLWKEIKIENLTFHGVKLCSRCKIPTINQENAVSASEPTETLMKFRSGKVVSGSKGARDGNALAY
ncbi:hypothetical protein L1987_83123 [Smallanthus sonchifolius]|uniref:Uncharacterized protein n=1 Tax=Smallanthus sonchifolius TaxID=185202 RepID=A0ACB8YBI3_9ASTR|nr:hypothetical protein L1987_83123 [Smallanthus sonchifolius]